MCNSINTLPPRAPANRLYSSDIDARFQPCNRLRHPITVPLRWRPIPQQTINGYACFLIMILRAVTIEDSVSWSHGLEPSVTIPKWWTSIPWSSANAKTGHWDLQPQARLSFVGLILVKWKVDWCRLTTTIQALFNACKVDWWNNDLIRRWSMGDTRFGII